jgi:hypothetical protein
LEALVEWFHGLPRSRGTAFNERPSFSVSEGEKSALGKLEEKSEFIVEKRVMLL